MNGREKIQALIDRLRSSAERRDHLAQKLLELSIEDENYANALAEIVARFSDEMLDTIAVDLRSGETSVS